MMSHNVYFTADLHLGHKNIVRATSDWTDPANTRDFPSVEAHDDYLIEQINKRVRSCDTLWHLGDFGMGFALKDRFPEIRARIKCERLCLLLGNHDHALESPKTKHLCSLFTRVDKLYYGKIAGRAMVLCHYAMRTWPWQNQNSIHLYGHSHGNLADDPNALSMDVGVDTCLFGHEKYTPYSAEEVHHIMDNFKKFVPVDHHA